METEVNQEKPRGTYRIVTDRLSKEFLQVCMETERMPETLQDDQNHSVFVLYSGLSYREAQERKRALMNTGFGNIWIEQASAKKGA